MAPRNATVRAVTAIRVFRLDRDGFAATIAGAFGRGRPHPNVTVERGFDH
jgi:hypothetical protein